MQAGKDNKSKFKEKLQNILTTSQAKLAEPLKKAFMLFNNTNLSRSNCNKMIMIITDGHSDDVSSLFNEYNAEKRVRVFSFKIGRDMTDPAIIKSLACNNNGEYYHVSTLTDINEHAYEYIPVLSRPMALNAVHEITWSNVFLGYLDKELKIAVGRPAFVNNQKFIEKLKKINLLKSYKLGLLNSTLYYDNMTNLTMEDYINSEVTQLAEPENPEYVYDSRETPQAKKEKRLRQAKKINNEQVLLGVVGLDVSVLKLISKVSPKYQMGVGIYMIMIDNNGFIVFHPSIKQQIALNTDSKGKFN